MLGYFIISYTKLPKLIKYQYFYLFLVPNINDFRYFTIRLSVPEVSKPLKHLYPIQLHENKTCVNIVS